jgi:hypothetical protein
VIAVVDQGIGREPQRPQHVGHLAGLLGRTEAAQDGAHSGQRQDLRRA